MSPRSQRFEAAERRSRPEPMLQPYDQCHPPRTREKNLFVGASPGCGAVAPVLPALAVDWPQSSEPVPTMSEILVPVSFGELLDKIAILQIKSERMTDPAKLANVRKELSALEHTWMQHPAAGGDIAQLRAQLKAVNERLWVIEDDIRIKEKAQEFDAEFVRLARSVYFENDERARVKKDINLALGSAYVEEKSYQDYRAGAKP